MSRPGAAGRPVEETRVRPLYVRVLRLRHFEPGAMVCFLLLEGTFAVALLLALAELVSWWGLILLPVAVAVVVKVNDVIAGILARHADQVPRRERERFRREIHPAIGRASAVGIQASTSGARATVPVGQTEHPGPVPAGTDRRGTVYVSSARPEQPDPARDRWGSPGEQLDRPGGRPGAQLAEANRPHAQAVWQDNHVEWHGVNGRWQSEQPEGHSVQPEWRDDPRTWRDDPRTWRDDRQAWRGEPPEWRGDPEDWPRAGPSPEHRYG